MADDDVQGGPSPFTAQSVYPADSGATNPELADMFLRRRHGDMAQRQPQIDDVFNKMSLNTESMTKMLDDTTAAIKAARGGGSGGVNLPLMAMASGLLSSRGNFGEQLGAGLGRMVPAIASERDNETNMNMQLAQLGLRRAGLENIPLEAKLNYLKAMQAGDMAATRGIEQALIRAQSKTGGVDVKSQQLMQKTVNDALKEARQAIEVEAKDSYGTQEERARAIKERFIQNVRVQQANGLPIPQKVIDEVTSAIGNVGGESGSTLGRGSYFDAPTSPEALTKTRERGMPPPPTGYVYENIGPKDKKGQLDKQTEIFAKERKDWDTQSIVQRKMLGDIETIERILDKHPNITGKNLGIIPNAPFGFGFNRTPESQTLDSKFKDIQIHNVPQGQGAVSNMERTLFEGAGASMEHETPANKHLLGIQKEIVKRDVDRRAFFSEYWNNYKTTDGMVDAWDRYIYSPAGSSFTYDKAGNPVINKREDWREFFKKEWPVKKADGGYIKLDEAYD